MQRGDSIERLFATLGLSHHHNVRMTFQFLTQHLASRSSSSSTIKALIGSQIIAELMPGAFPRQRNGV